MTTFAKILLGVDNSVMPRQLLQADRAPFFGILMMTPLFQSSGIFLLSHMVLKSGCNMLPVVTASALNSSALRRSLPGALCFFRELMAAMISSFFGGPVSGSSSGGGLLRTSLKCCTQRASWSFSELRSCPCLSCMGTFLLPLYFPQISLVT